MTAERKPRRLSSGGTGRLVPLPALLPVLAVLCLLSGCHSRPPYEILAPSSLPATRQALPLPSGPTVLVISGAIARDNHQGRLLLDLSTLERFGMVTYTIQDPWLKTNVRYSGVLMSDLLEQVGASTSAAVVHLVALDDYQVEIPIAELKRWPIMLATRQNGQAIPVEEGGPTRIIYPVHAFPALGGAAYRNDWIWSVASMDVR